MFPILIADDASSWFESGAVRDVTIRNNVFEECGYNSGSGAIAIAPENHELVAGKMVHRNISITGNTFKVFNDAVLSARSVDNLLFSGNNIFHTGFTGQEKKIAAIELAACKNVIIENNRFDTAEPQVINAVKMTKKDFRSDIKVNVKL
jgi:polygalacturonase